jgi:hypothetical protein
MKVVWVYLVELDLVACFDEEAIARSLVLVVLCVL